MSQFAIPPQALCFLVNRDSLTTSSTESVGYLVVQRDCSLCFFGVCLLVVACCVWRIVCADFVSPFTSSPTRPAYCATDVVKRRQSKKKSLQLGGNVGATSCRILRRNLNTMKQHCLALLSLLRQFGRLLVCSKVALGHFFRCPSLVTIS